jgi:hypothetical protein
MLIRFLLGFAWGLAALPASHGASAPSPADVKAALGKATEFLASISTEGGYLWRYSADLKDRRGEAKATTTQIWVQPPGTPSVGMAFLNAYTATKDERHLAAAHNAARALARGQLESGGWTYVIEFDPKARRNWAYHTDAAQSPGASSRRRNVTTFDDDNTQSALRFLLAFLDTATNRPAAELKPIREALDFGLAKMLEAQHPNGAWPQGYEGTPPDAGLHPVQPARFPADWPRSCPKTNYWLFYTLNDQTQRDCIRTMVEAGHRLGDRRYLDAARRGGEFLILAQLPEPQPAWAQQYNFRMEPVWARAFEPPAVCSNESAGAMRTLVELFLETGEERFLEPIPRFIAWLKRSQVTPNQWARYYELRTNKPIYGDRDGQVHYTLAEISEERQRGYSWQGSYGIPETIAHYEAVKSQGRDKFLAEQRKCERPAKPSADRVARILAQQDTEGRWLANGWIETRVFIANMRVLSDYLQSP